MQTTPTRKRAATIVVGLLIAALTIVGWPTTASAGPISEMQFTAPNYSVANADNNFIVPIDVHWTPPTSWAPAGERLTADHRGIVYRTNPTTGARTVLVDISSHVNAYTDRGLNAIAVDPDYATNQYLYLWYTYENNPGAEASCKTSTLTRVKVTQTGVQLGAPNTNAQGEFTLLGSNHGGTCTLDANGEAIGSACPTGTTLDCIPSDSGSHSVGDIEFATDKTMFLTHGDGASYGGVDGPRAFRAQNPDSLAGKVLRITRDGAGLTTNPYANGSTTSNRSKVWSMGVRNMFRFTLVNDIPVGGNVGWNKWEEIEVHTNGTNGGWPCYEGDVKSTEGYQNTSECIGMYNAGTVVKNPLFKYPHNGGEAAVTGGIVIPANTNKYPAALAGAYLFADYTKGTIWKMRFDANFQITEAPTVFATEGGGPVQFTMGPDGVLHYVNINDGEVRRIVYTAPGADCATGQWKIEYFPNADRAGNPTYTTCESVGTNPKLDKNWGTGAPVGAPTGFPTDNWSARATCVCTFTAGTYNFTTEADNTFWLYVDNVYVNYGGDVPLTNTLTLAAGTHTVKVTFVELTGNARVKANWANTTAPPQIAIGTPANNQEVAAGATVNYSASVAKDGQGNPLPPSAVSWKIEQHHCVTATECHVHYVNTHVGLSGSFIMPPKHTPDSLSLTVRATALDPATNLSTETTVDVKYPVVVTPPTSCATDQWKLEYYPNLERAGTPTVVCEAVGTSGPKFSKNWGTVLPTFNPPATPTNGWTMRATCVCTFATSGTYNFSTVADDSIWLFADNVELHFGGTVSKTTPKALTAGTHTMKFVFTQGTGTASVSLNWALAA